jgi:hypothetical protein
MLAKGAKTGAKNAKVKIYYSSPFFVVLAFL